MKEITTGFGSPLIDHLARIDESRLAEFGLVKGGMKLVDPAEVERLHALIGRTDTVTGGAAANTILALSRLGSPAAFSGKIAPDQWGAFFADSFRRQGVRDLLVRSEPKKATGRVLSCVTPDGERSFATCLGVAIEFSPADLTDAMFADARIVFVEGYLIMNQPLVEAIFQQAKRHGAEVALDMASWNVVQEHRERFLSYLKEYVDIVFANEEEAKALCGEDGEKALDFISERCAVSVVKLGSKGSLARRSNERVNLPIQPVKPVDTTGAGDLYAGGFLHAYQRKASLEACCRLGSAVSREVVQVTGATLDDETWLRLRGEAAEILGR